jgi:tyrosine-protein kinase Etk/Wzc
MTPIRFENGERTDSRWLTDTGKLIGMNTPDGESRSTQRFIRRSTASTISGQRTASHSAPAPLEFDNEDGGLAVSIEGAEFVAFSDRTARSLRYLLGRLRATSDETAAIGLTSAMHGEGTTFLSRSIAALVAHDFGQSVCWVDVNWWKSASSPSPSKSAAPAIADIVVGRADIDDVISETSIYNLSIVTAGVVPAGSRSMVANSEALAAVIETLRSRFDAIVLDLPPVLATSDAAALARLANAYVLVVGQRIATSEQVRSALGAMEPTPFLGSVVNSPRSRSRKQSRK